METATTLGRYEILSELGRGAMGVVYKAVDPVLNRIVAIKTVNLAFDPEERKEYEGRFLQEAKAAGSLSHPAIVTIYDLGNNGNVAYMAMEFLDGDELRRVIDVKQKLPVRQAVAIVTQVAEGLGYAHQRSIVHRDIKPANIMVLKDGTAKITDFGIARMRVSEVKTQTGMRLGSPKYMSPEQVLGQPVDHRSDLFSLGIVLYEALTGKAPFTAASIDSLMYQTMNATPPAPSRLNPDVPEMLDLIVARTLEKKPESRYQSAKELVADLRECERYFGALGPEDMERSGLYEPPPGLLEDEKTQVLGKPGETASEDVGNDSVGISRLFDSFEATQRLAREVGMENEFDQLSSTLRLARTDKGSLVKDPHTEPKASPMPAAQAEPDVGSMTQRSWVVGEADKRGWSANEKFFVGGVLVATLIAAAMIAFV